VLWDAIDALNPSATVVQNEAAIQNSAFAWVSQSSLEKGFKDYIDSVRTFPELVQDGMAAYSAGQLKTAQADFKQAISLNAKNYVPYYYQGLVSYSGKDYYLAEQYFQTALQMGGDQGLINYALGINAFADNRIADAKKYLSQAVSVQSDYKDKAASLLDRVNQQSAQ
jgi:tetratricopeptide (TPR) repeat protein